MASTKIESITELFRLSTGRKNCLCWSHTVVCTLHRRCALKLKIVWIQGFCQVPLKSQQWQPQIKLSRCLWSQTRWEVVIRVARSVIRVIRWCITQNPSREEWESIITPAPGSRYMNNAKCGGRNIKGQWGRINIFKWPPHLFWRRWCETINAEHITTRKKHSSYRKSHWKIEEGVFVPGKTPKKRDRRTCSLVFTFTLPETA